MKSNKQLPTFDSRGLIAWREDDDFALGIKLGISIGFIFALIVVLPKIKA